MTRAPNKQLVRDAMARYHEQRRAAGPRSAYYDPFTYDMYRAPSHQNALADLIKGLAEYADAHAARYGTTIGEDYVLGPGWKQIAEGVRTLLNGELGELDGGTLDATLLDMAAANGLPFEP